MICYDSLVSSIKIHELWKAVIFAMRSPAFLYILYIIFWHTSTHTVKKNSDTRVTNDVYSEEIIKQTTRKNTNHPNSTLVQIYFTVCNAKLDWFILYCQVRCMTRKLKNILETRLHSVILGNFRFDWYTVSPKLHHFKKRNKSQSRSYKY